MRDNQLVMMSLKLSHFLARLRIVDSDVSDEQAEEQLENQLELVIRQVKDELSLIPKMIGKSAWLTNSIPSTCNQCALESDMFERS